MNRLWVRLSLAFGMVVILVSLVFGITARIFFEENMKPGPEMQPEVREYLRQLRQERNPIDMTTVIVVVGGVAIGAGIMMSRTLTAPMKELGEAAQAIGRQDLSRRIAVSGTDEVQAMAVRFNEMAQQLEQAESLRSNLLADVAHELRNPLHVLQGNLQAILDGVYSLSNEEIARLADQTRLLTTLVDDLYILAQAEAQQLPLYKEKTDIAQLVKETADAYRPLARANDVTLRVELLGTIPTMEVDADRLRQVLNNLLSNALRHSPKDGEIRIVVEQKPPQLTIRVEDEGFGINPEHLDHVFERFYRTDSARSRDKGGTGLGLAIVKAIVEAHDGQVSAQSLGQGQGSVFTVSLPLN
jgi:signal transduction histidine kinase